MRRTLAGIVIASMSGATLGAAGASDGRAQTAITTTADCAVELGGGEQSRRRFCDVVIAARGGDSIRMVIPAHDGPAVLQMDLHNRFTIPAAGVAPADAFERHSAVVAVVAGDGAVLERASVTREFRTVQDLFDRIGGGARPGGVKSVAPGGAESVRVTVPAGIDEIGVVGVRLHVLSRRVDDTFAAPGRPVAIVSNLRIEYHPK
jgi:hypothetical protein